MKIAFVTNEYVTESNFDGGLSNYLFKITGALRNRGHEVFVITSSYTDEVIVHNDITVIRVKVGLEVLKLFEARFFRKFKEPLFWIIQSFQLNKVLRTAIKKYQIDIIQYSSFQGTALFRPKSPVSIVRISSVQSLWDEAYGQTKTISNRLTAMLEIYALKRVNKVYSPSVYLSRFLNMNYSLDVDIIEGPVKIDIKKDSSVLNEKIGRKKFFLFYGTIGLLKGAKEISSVLNSFFENTDYYFVMIGKDAKFDNESMIKYIKKENKKFVDRIIFLPPIPHESLYPIVSAAEAVVLPSRVDNLPNTCTESMSLGKIVIGTQGTSFEQLIVDGKSGFLCLPNNAKSLEETINRVILLTPLEKDMIEKEAIKRMEDLLPSKVSEKLENLFKKVLYN